ncbi:MAG TPA: class I SAM-dependent methyltransferase [Acetobacteraceae bacterium]|nr:class I SAM-dependent methyltransferase [Acetobacteraceae bacterium]
MTERFAADWLALREPFDHSARSIALARRLADVLPRRPRVLDLGAGTGSMFRFLAPIIGRGQDWILLDADAALLDEAFGHTAAWARRRHFAAMADQDELRVTTPQGLWRLQAMAGDLSRFNSEQANVDAIVCSALLDLVSAAWLSRFCTHLRVPFLACLTADGRDVWRPRHAYDALVRSAFRRDMRRDKGFGSALGISAAHAFMHAASAPSEWRIPRTALRMQRALIDGTADAARNANPARAGAIGAWQEARLHQALRGRLAITIGHRDILVLPPGG